MPQIQNFSVELLSICCCSVTPSCLTLCDPRDCGMPGLPVPHHLRSFPKLKHFNRFYRFKVHNLILFKVLLTKIVYSVKSPQNCSSELFSVEKIIKIHNAQAFMVEMKTVLVNLLGDSPKGDGLVVQAGPGTHIPKPPLLPPHRILYLHSQVFYKESPWICLINSLKVQYLKRLFIQRSNSPYKITIH